MKVVLIVATSADGRIALTKDHLATTWTTQADKVFFTKKTKQIGVMIMGLTTYKTFGLGLKGRRLIVLSDETMPATENVEFINSKPAEVLKKLKSEGVEQVAICGGSFVYSEFLRQGLVDEMFINIMPALLGDGIPFVKFDGVKKLKLVDATAIGDDSVSLHYVVQK